MLPRLGLTCAALLVFAACGGGDEAVSTTLPLPPKTTTTPPTETTDPVPVQSSSPTTTSTTSTSTPTTSTITSTTLVGELSLAAAIQRDLNAGEEALLRAGMNPAGAESRELIERYFSGPSREKLLSVLVQLATDGLIAQANPDVPAEIILTSAPVLIEGSNGTRAEAETCRVDSTMIVDPAVVVDGEPAIVNDEVLRTIASSRFNFVNGLWQLDGGELIEDTLGATSCVA